MEDNKSVAARTDDPVVNWLIWGIAALGTMALMAIGVWGKNELRRSGHRPGNLTACKSNLKNIGTALEMYSTDFSGKYPPRLDVLTPNYLKTIPSCPTVSKVTYRAYFGKGAPLNTGAFEDYYYLECAGANHTSVSVMGNYPAYNAIQGLVERAP